MHILTSHSQTPAGDVLPTELAAVSNSVGSGWHVTTGTSIVSTGRGAAGLDGTFTDRATPNLKGTYCGWLLDPRFPTLQGHTGTQSVDYRNRDITGTIPTEFGLLTDVEYFQLGLNTLTSTIPTELGALVKVSSRFHLEQNSLTSVVPTEL